MPKAGGGRLSARGAARGRRALMMSDNDRLVVLLRAALAGAGSLREVRMFGGTCFMLDGNMIAGASPRGLLVRVGKDRHDEALARGARAMEMRDRIMAGYVFVDPKGLDDRALREWIAMARGFVATLPPKTSPPKHKRTKGNKP